MSSLAPDEVVRRRKRDLEAALRDTRNLVSACRRHHDLYHGARFQVPADRWPVSVRMFASEYGLMWVLERAA